METDIMTKEEALYKFWSSFSLEAYEENSVPTGEHTPELPYITYQVSISDFEGPVYLTASIWNRSEGWIWLNSKAQEVSDYISRGGVMLPCDGGAIWIKRAQPFSLQLADEKDNAIKRKILNIAVEFLTAN